MRRAESFVSGRPGMISAATGAMALLMVTLVKEHESVWLEPVAQPLQVLAKSSRMAASGRAVAPLVDRFSPGSRHGRPHAQRGPGDAAASALACGHTSKRLLYM